MMGIENFVAVEAGVTTALKALRGLIAELS